MRWRHAPLLVALAAASMLAAGWWWHSQADRLSLRQARREVLRPGSRQTWRIETPPGQHAEVEIRTAGASLAIRLIDAAGRPRLVLPAEGPRWTAGWVAAPPGLWTIEVSSAAAAPVPYAVELTARRAATARDRRAWAADLLDGELRRALDHLDEERALALAARAVALREELYGQEPRALATYLNDLGVDLMGGGCATSEEVRERARSLISRALAIRERGGDPLDAAESLGDLATVATYDGRWEEAVVQEERALAIRRRRLPPGDPLIGDGLAALGYERFEQGRYGEAGALFGRALNLFLKARPRDERRLAEIYNSLGELRRVENNYDDAAESLRLAYQYAVNGTALGDVLLAKIINNEAGLAQDEGDYRRAEIQFRRSLLLRQQSPQTCPRDLATAYLNLGDNYLLQEDYDSAERLLAKGRERATSALGADDSELAWHLEAAALLYQEERRYDSAKPLYEEALRLSRGAFGGVGSAHPMVAMSLHDLADLDAELGDDGQAEALYRQALAIRERALGERHPEVAATLTHLARVLARTGRAGASRAALDRALAIFADTRADPEAQAQAWELRAELRRRGGDLGGGLADLQKSLEIVERLRPLVSGGERQRAGFAARHADSYDRMVEWQLDAGRLDAAVEYAERSRARALVDQLAQAKVDLRSRIPAERRRPLEQREAAAKSHLAEANHRLALLEQRGVPAAGAADREALSGLLAARETAELELERVEADVASESPLWRMTAGAPTASLSAIQSQLVPPGGLLLLYQVGAEASRLFVLPRAPGTARALALAVPPAAAAVLGVEPGALTRDTLRRILEAGGLSAALGQNPRNRPPGTGASLLPRLHALWQVVVPEGLWEEVRASAQVIVVPGPLYPIPFEALVVALGGSSGGPDGGVPGGLARFWLDDGPPLRYAASATALSTLAERGRREVREPPAGASIVSVSDPAFDAPSGAPAASASSGGVPAETARERFARAGEALARLPGTAAETRLILEAFGDARSGGKVLALQGARADERSVRAALAGKRILHLATHGLVDERRHEMFAALALAASPGGKVQSDGDGLLQLFEIYQLDLDAELAVLSACSTHAGPEVEGEGVFALSRGFLIAGARRVVASLWRVNDRATAVLIGELFRRLAAEERAGRHPPYAEALRAAKAAVRARPETSDPYFWAPFTLSGEG